MSAHLMWVRLPRVRAERTIGLPMEAVAFVDAQVAAFAHKVGFARLERRVEDQVCFESTTRIEGEQLHRPAPRRSPSGGMSVRPGSHQSGLD